MKYHVGNWLLYSNSAYCFHARAKIVAIKTNRSGGRLYLLRYKDRSEAWMALSDECWELDPDPKYSPQQILRIFVR